MNEERKETTGKQRERQQLPEGVIAPAALRPTKWIGGLDPDTRVQCKIAKVYLGDFGATKQHQARSAGPDANKGG